MKKKNIVSDEAVADIVKGIPENFRTDAARLYDHAFGEKISLAIPKTADRIELYTTYFDLQHTVAAISADKLLGLAGYSTSTGSLTGGINYKDLISDLGILRGNRAAIVLGLYERKTESGELLMDGLAVDQSSRGLGIGTRLLSELIEFAHTNDYTSIRLDVIDTNPGAKRLYERIGFVETKTQTFEILRGVLGFGASSTLIYRFDADVSS